MSSDTAGSSKTYNVKEWENPFKPGTYMHQLFRAILKQGRGVIIILDDLRGRRGTGKTTASLKLADGMDQNEGVGRDNASLSVEEVRNAYTELPIRSGMVLDEAEVGASNRDPMTKTNKALREIMSMGRIEQKYIVVNAPIKGFIDKDIQRLADVWISMTRKGRALVHQLKWEPYSENLHTPKRQWLEFNDIETGTKLRDAYNYLTREKRKRIGGSDGSGFIPRDEARERIQKAKKEAAKSEREELIYNLYTNPAIQESGITQSDIADAAGVSQGTVSNIVNRIES